jgi:2-oxo-3-hexenedioate decarboxylase
MDPELAARQLRDAREAKQALVPFTDQDPDLTESWAYEVQALDRSQRAAAGDSLIGVKLGLTSAAKQQRMGVGRPIAGFLTSSMQLGEAEVGGAMSQWIQPRIEPEIAFVTSRVLDRALARDEVEACVASVMMAAEIIDSRWADYRFRLPDVVADNTSAAGVVVSDLNMSLHEVGDLAALRCEVVVDGEIVHTATGAAILGDPLLAVQWLSEHLERRGESLPAGSLVLAGALTDAVPLLAGRTYELSIEGLGSVSTTPAVTPA